MGFVLRQYLWIIVCVLVAYTALVMLAAHSRGGYYNPVVMQAEGTVVQLGQCSRGECLFLVEADGKQYRVYGSPTLVNTTVKLTVFKDQTTTVRDNVQRPHLFRFWETK